MKNGYSLYKADQLMQRCHRLRLTINKVHESGNKGSFIREANLMHEYDRALDDLFEYLKEYCNDI